MAGDGDEEAAVSIHIRIPLPNGARFSVAVNLNSSVEDLEDVLAERCGIPAKLQRLIYKARIMQGGRTLKSFGVEEDACIHLVRVYARSAAVGVAEKFLAVIRSDPFIEIYTSSSENIRSLRFLVSVVDDSDALDLLDAALERTRLVYNVNNVRLLHFLLTGTHQNSAAAAVALPDQEAAGYGPQLYQLQEFGFSDAQENIRALTATAGNARAAVRRLLDIRHNLRSF